MITRKTHRQRAGVGPNECVNTISALVCVECGYLSGEMLTLKEMGRKEERHRQIELRASK